MPPAKKTTATRKPPVKRKSPVKRKTAKKSSTGWKIALAFLLLILFSPLYYGYVLKAFTSSWRWINWLRRARWGMRLKCWGLSTG